MWQLNRHKKKPITIISQVMKKCWHNILAYLGTVTYFLSLNSNNSIQKVFIECEACSGYVGCISEQRVIAPVEFIFSLGDKDNKHDE